MRLYRKLVKKYPRISTDKGIKQFVKIINDGNKNSVFCNGSLSFNGKHSEHDRYFRSNLATKGNFIKYIAEKIEEEIYPDCEHYMPYTERRERNRCYKN